MKNLVAYFYEIVPEKTKITSLGYYIYTSGCEYLFKENTREINELLELYSLSNNSPSLHKIILNKYGMILSNFNDKEYIMLEIRNMEERKINLNDILNLSKIEITENYRYINRNDWKILWINKVDYIERNYYEYNRDIIKYLDYNVGLTENAIQIFMTVNSVKKTINHIKINPNMKMIEFYDPTNVVLDTKARDICEFYRNSIDDNPKNIERVPFNLLDNKEKALFFVRFLFNKEYFDSLEEDTSDNINKLCQNMKNHEVAIQTLYKELKESLPEIEWLKKAS